MNGTTISTLSRNNFNQLLESQEDTKKMITVEEISPSAHAYQKGNYLIFNNQLYKVTTAITVGDVLSTSTNLEAVNVGEELKATARGSAGGEVITPPTLTSATSFVYDGTSKSLTFSGYDEETMVMNSQSAINAGPHASAIALKNGNNLWSDTNTALPKVYPWEITRAQATLSVNSTSVTLNDNTSSMELTITKTGDGTLSAVSSDDNICSASIDGTTLTITLTNPVFNYTTVTIALSDTSNCIVPPDIIINVTVYGTIVSWSSGTDDQIVAMVEGADRGMIDLYNDAGWRVGDTRTVSLSAMSATYVGESHVAQDVEFVLMHQGTMNLASATVSGRTKCSFVVGMKNFLANGTTGEYGYMESTSTNQKGWHACIRRTWCNEVFREAIPSTLRSIFKQFTHSVAAAGYSNNLSPVVSTDWFSLPTEKNIFGVRTYCPTQEFNATDNFQFTWYKTEANRVKRAGSNGSAYSWWECSPSYSNAYDYCYTLPAGTAYCSTSTYTWGISPFGVI